VCFRFPIVSRSLAVAALLNTCLAAAQFHSGQAARAIIGQRSFSAKDAGIAATSLAISNGKLYAADASGRVFAFDLVALPGPKADMAGESATGCAVCELSPTSVVNQSVLPGIAAVSVHDRTVLIADTARREVSIWRDVSSPQANNAPDVILTAVMQPVSVAFDGARVFVGDAALHRVLVWNSIPTAGNQPPDAALGEPGDVASPDTIGRPDALVSDGLNVFVADGVNRRILVFTAGDVPLANNAIVNSANLTTGPLAPGTLVTISGTGLSEESRSAPDDGVHALPKKLAGVELVFDGFALPLLSASPTEIRAQLPYDTGDASSASLYVRTERSDGSVTITNAIPLKLTAANPGVFAFGGPEPRAGMLLHGQAGAPVTEDSPVHPGEAVTLWTAGLGLVDTGDPTIPVLPGIPYAGMDAPVEIPVRATVNGIPAEVSSAVLPKGSIGVYEVRVVIPAGLEPDSRAQLFLMQNGSLSNTVTFPIGSTIQ